jgi:hypothetical protein
MRTALVEKPEMKRPLGKPRNRWKDNTKTDLKGTAFGYLDLIYMVQDRNLRWTFVNTVMNLQAPQMSVNFSASLPSDFSRRTMIHGVSFWLILLFVFVSLFVYLCICLFVCNTEACIYKRTVINEVPQSECNFC